MGKNIDKLANSTSDDLFDSSDADDFERMLNDFIAQEFEDEEPQSTEEKKSEPQLSGKENTENEDDSQELMENIQSTIEESTTNTPLNEREFSLLRAYRNFMYAVNILAEENSLSPISLRLTEELLYPHYKKKAGSAVSRDVFSDSLIS